MGRLVVLNKDEDTVSIIDPDTGETETTVGTDFNPHEVIVTPDGEKTYVTCSLGGAINVIDNDTFEVVERLEGEHFEFPHGLAIAGDELWMAATRSERVFVIDWRTDEILDAFPTHQEWSHMVAVSPDGTTAYVANIGSDSVSVIDVESRAVTATFPVGESPEGIATAPSGEVYVANQDDDDLYVVDPETYEVTDERPLGTTPIRVVFSPDGRYAFVPNREGNTLSVIDTAHERDGETVPWEVKRPRVGVWPGGTAFSPDGSRAFVANNKTNDVSVIDVGTLTETRRIDAGVHPDGIAYLER